MWIAWGPVLQAGAEAAATAFGKSVGEGLGSAFIDAILGKGSEDTDLQKLETSIARLEDKIDKLARYVINVLPDVVYNGSLLADIRVKIEQHKSLHLAVESDLAAYRKTPTGTNEIQLISSTREFLVNAHTLVGFGAPYYVIAQQAAVTATFVYTQLIKNDVAGQDAAFRKYAEGFRKAIEPWLQTSSETTIPAQLARAKKQYLESKQIADDFPSGVPHFLLTAWGPEKQENVGGMTGLTAYNYKILIGYFDRRNGAWWTGGDPFTTSASFFGAPLATEWDWDALINDVRVGGSLQKPLLLSWAPPTRDHPSGWHYGDYFSATARIYNRHLDIASTFPKIIQDQENILESIQSTFEIWKKYEEGPI